MNLSSLDLLRDTRLKSAVADALRTGDTRRVRDELERVSGLPGPRPNLVVAEVYSRVLVLLGAQAAELVRDLEAWDRPFAPILRAFWIVERALAEKNRSRLGKLLEELVAIGESDQFVERLGAIAALRMALRSRGDDALSFAHAFVDSYLGEHVVLEALSDPEVLSQLQDGDEIVSHVRAAFAMSEEAPRAAERTQGLRALRDSLPAQWARIAARFPSEIDALETAAKGARPENRVIVEATVKLLQKTFGDEPLARVRAALVDHAPKPRDPSRIVQGTRKRGGGRRR